LSQSTSHSTGVTCQDPHNIALGIIQSCYKSDHDKLKSSGTPDSTRMRNQGGRTQEILIPVHTINTGACNKPSFIDNDTERNISILQAVY
jgi:hypothetical protein